mgnify:CR=1 FL=1
MLDAYLPRLLDIWCVGVRAKETYTWTGSGILRIDPLLPCQIEDPFRRLNAIQFGHGVVHEDQFVGELEVGADHVVLCLRVFCYLHTLLDHFDSKLSA